MNTLGIIATIIGILGGGGIIGLLGKVIKMASDYQKLKGDLEQVKALVAQNKERDDEERRNNAAKFTELYNSRNKTNETLIELTTTVKIMVSNMDQQFAELGKKVDELKKEKC